MTPSLHNIKPILLVKFLQKEGFILKRITGSHHIFFHPISLKITTVPIHTKELPIGTAIAIIRQAGHTNDDFVQFVS